MSKAENEVCAPLPPTKFLLMLLQYYYLCLTQTNLPLYTQIMNFTLAKISRQFPTTNTQDSFSGCFTSYAGRWTDTSDNYANVVMTYFCLHHQSQMLLVEKATRKMSVPQSKLSNSDNLLPNNPFIFSEVRCMEEVASHLGR